MAQCHSCKKEVEIVDGRVGRRDDCIHCGADLHCCYNCIYYEKTSHNECREPVATRVNDKDRSNFCEYFKMGDKAYNDQDVRAEAKRKLDALFAKKT